METRRRCRWDFLRVRSSLIVRQCAQPIDGPLLWGPAGGNASGHAGSAALHAPNERRAARPAPKAARSCCSDAVNPSSLNACDRRPIDPPPARF